MKKYLFLCLTLCLLLLFVGCGEKNHPEETSEPTETTTVATEPSTTETEAPSTTETESPVALDTPYYHILQTLKEAAPEDDGNGTGGALLYDLDGNGTEELITLYLSDHTPQGATNPIPYFVCDVYTTIDGEAVPLMEKREVRPYQSVAGTYGKVQVLRFEGQIYLCIMSSRGDVEASDETWNLYALKEGQAVLEKEAFYSYENFANDEATPKDLYTIDGEEVDSAAYEALLESFETLETLDGYNEEYSFESLLIRLAS